MLRIIKILIILLIMLPAVASAQLPRLASVPDELPPGIRESLQLDKASLEWKRSDLRARVNNFNSECASVKAGSAEDTECREVYGRLNGEMQSLATEISAFNMAVKQAFAEAKSKVKTAPPSSLTFMGPKAAPAKSGIPLNFEPPRLVNCGKSRECIESIWDKPVLTERDIEILREFDRDNPPSGAANPKTKMGTIRIPSPFPPLPTSRTSLHIKEVPPPSQKSALPPELPLPMPPTSGETARVGSIRGPVFALTANGWVAVDRNFKLKQGETLWVQPGGYAEIVFKNGFKAQLKPGPSGTGTGLTYLPPKGSAVERIKHGLKRKLEKGLQPPINIAPPGQAPAAPRG